MKRAEMISKLNEEKEWDIIVIGGGATGLGIAVDAASRGYQTVLFEQYDFAKGTSSRSTKLVHGGVRYLAQGNIKLVREALYERGLLLKNAPHLTRRQTFIVPSYHWWEKWFYGAGLKIYDLLSGKLSLGKTKFLSKKEVLKYLPFAETKKLSGGVLYYDGQFDDARLAVNLAQTAAEQGAAIINYCGVESLIKDKKKVKGVVVKDILSNKEYSIKGKAVINATGVFADDILKMDNPESPEMISPSQGIHVVLDKKFFPGDCALMIPKTDDDRVLFAVPWHDKVVVGTTDTAIEEILSEPEPLEEEIDFIIRHFNHYLTADIKRSDVKSVFVGLRPLVKSGNAKSTALISRDHTILVSPAGLITVTGGKWTTYRKMAKDAVENAVFIAKIPRSNCVTDELKLHGWTEQQDETDPLHIYGSDAAGIRKIMAEFPETKERLHPAMLYTKAEVVWSVQHEMAMTVEDVLARRMRMLFLDARAAAASAKVVAEIMAKEMNKGEEWIKEQEEEFKQLAEGYIL
ncbi:MAG: glycerol-3-phosphate dehydrogenase/oxidase [Chitinophagaceae bacterium]|nr:glycerol-3-phosphate dehydrogenase/oxidase [Chitinophagaceae bacterium]